MWCWQDDFGVQRWLILSAKYRFFSPNWLQWYSFTLTIIRGRVTGSAGQSTRPKHLSVQNPPMGWHTQTHEVTLTHANVCQNICQRETFRGDDACEHLQCRRPQHPDSWVRREDKALHSHDELKECSKNEPLSFWATKIWYGHSLPYADRGTAALVFLVLELNKLHLPGW